MDDVLQKLPSLPSDLSFVVDGNLIYCLAQQLFAQHGISFHVHQVIGLTNEDPVLEEFRPLKPIIERFKQTFKDNYRPTHGVVRKKAPVSFVTLFAAYFNFLRPTRRARSLGTGRHPGTDRSSTYADPLDKAYRLGSELSSKQGSLTFFVLQNLLKRKPDGVGNP
ncbi:hypothetical protein [Geobacillus thermodenitrificans]|jgi:hypothetical protein|nr:hypothetical protein [Geobacillus thermodenitrificans]ARP42911.1 hypothetical protein GTHT12_01372 [Geobacillus thermodenitrificans]